MHEVRSAVHELFYRKCCCIVASPWIKVLVNTRKCNCWESLPGVSTCLPLGHSHSLPDRALLPDPTEKEERQVHINTGQEEKKERKGKERRGFPPPSYQIDKRERQVHIRWFTIRVTSWFDCGLALLIWLIASHSQPSEQSIRSLIDRRWAAGAPSPPWTLPSLPSLACTLLILL